MTPKRQGPEEFLESGPLFGDGVGAQRAAPSEPPADAVETQRQKRWAFWRASGLSEMEQFEAEAAHKLGLTLPPLPGQDEEC